ncbi:thymine dioxygenase [Verticillium alfalfae VaMs.102]|uniref:Thymine dioxygenase n=1 Tax=Verticillium alfalfae (strain VaMs.102 / ATCC MYA-4576 / FGSC 10136) TaxID=526221 RepID=C9SEC3_VERA1|nr:thymine dioxygenase [Verticillium alfalfae VaMs.102]EEY16516.1 thymine dioxygenase [Verticillium alfalfae VaMs.102]
MATAVSGEGLVIPLIDFSAFLHGDAAQRQATAREILHGFQTAGFIYLKNHPIDEATLERGLCRLGRLLRAVRRGQARARLDDARGQQGLLGAGPRKGQPAHRRQRRVGRAAGGAGPEGVRAGEHSDYGSITLLFQDARGGLQVRGPGGRFVDATPIPGTVVVNAGDLLARWSNDTIRSTVHRVVEPPGGGADGDVYPPRYSIAYFCNPNYKDYIEALPGTYASEAEKKYEGINSGEYLVQRLTATY